MKPKNENQNSGFKELTVIVNGQQKVVTQKIISFAELVALAFFNLPTGPNIVFSITYRRGQGNKPEGILTPGQEVKIKEGTVFNVTATDKS